MNIVDAPLSVLSKFVTFSGRASRSEFWWWWLIMVFIQLSLSGGVGHMFGSVLVIIYLAFLLPTFAVIVRRLHDLDASGWWALIGLIPIGMLVILIWCIKKGTDGPNKYGDDPLEAL